MLASVNAVVRETLTRFPAQELARKWFGKEMKAPYVGEAAEVSCGKHRPGIAIMSCDSGR